MRNFGQSWTCGELDLRRAGPTESWTLAEVEFEIETWDKSDTEDEDGVNCRYIDTKREELNQNNEVSNSFDPSASSCSGTSSS